MKIVVGIPAFNEEKNIGKVIISLKKIVKAIPTKISYESDDEDDNLYQPR